MTTTTTFDEAVAHAAALRKGLDARLRDTLSPALAAAILADIDDYADARRRLVALAAGEMLVQTT
jgi:hypothetical protein